MAIRKQPLPITGKPIATASVGKNAEQFRDILRLYIEEGSVIADVTFGHGWFWKLVDNSKYTVLASDMSDRIFNSQIHAFDTYLRLQADMTCLPYRDESLDCLVCDPPYGKNGGANPTFGITKAYNLEQKPRYMVNILSLYERAALEACRAIKQGGIAIVKCQDSIESKQWWMHSLVRQKFEENGFELVDLFILVQENTPIMRHRFQWHARKNHSYWLIMKRN